MGNPSTGTLDIRANRWEPFVRTFDFERFDYFGASFIAQVRAVKDSSGTPLVNLATVGSVATEGITITGTTVVDGVTTTHVSMRINEATMEAIALANPLGDDYPLYWDMQITPSGGVKYRAIEGQFIVHSGVTH